MINRNILFSVMIFNVVIAWAAPTVGNQQDGSEVKPRFFFNDDGDRGIMLVRGPFQERQLYYAVDNLLGTGVTTLVYCANLGSDQAYYPSKVASALDWRMTESHRPDNPVPVFPRVYQVGKMAREQGIDILGTVMRYAREKGLEFVPSLRMNDGHFGNNLHPTVHPLTGEFWMKHPDMVIGPIDRETEGYQEFCQYLLNFEHEAVREYRMGQIYELIDGYAADGFEMDFTRHYMFFPPGLEKPELITEMVRKARGRLDGKNKTDGRQRFLIARVAHSLERNRQLGLDVPSWIREGLVDYLVPSSPDRAFAFEIPIDEFIALAKGTRCRVVAGPDSYGADGPIYRAGFSNYYAMGQKDAYLFNFFTRGYPYSDEDFALLRDLSRPETLWGRRKDFYSDAYFQRGKTPLHQLDHPYTIPLFMGDDLNACRDAQILKFAALILEMNDFCPEDRFEVSLNGSVIPPQAIRREEGAIRCELRNGPLPKVGWNTVAITVKSLRGDDPPLLKRVHIKCDYDILGGGYHYVVPREFLFWEQLQLNETDTPTRIEMIVEEDLAACREAGILQSATLLVQIKNCGPEDVYECYLNDELLENPKVNVADEKTSFYFELKDGPLPKRRWNTVTVIPRKLSGSLRTYLRRVHLQTQYDLSAKGFEASRP